METSHNIPLIRRLIHSKALTCFHPIKGRESKGQKKTLELTEAGFWGLRKAAVEHNTAVQGKATSADAEAGASYPEDTARQFMKVATPNNRFSMQVKQTF